MPLVVLLRWIPPPEVRLVSTLPSGLHHLRCNNRMASQETWKWTNKTVLKQYRAYLETATNLELECLELSSKGCNELWLRDLRREVEQLCMDIGIRYEASGN